jgi:CheY-like chemotaxis protein
MYNGIEILIAEDDIASYMLLEEQMNSIGVANFWAKNGIEALDILSKENVTLILMDINMPIMDGITATRLIREKGIDIPIIFQTADVSIEKKNECFLAGGNELFFKPLKLDKLYMIFNKYLSESSMPS